MRSTDADFDHMSWHDCHVHGLHVQEGEHGTGTLILDIDYIVEWLPRTLGLLEFLVAPADLVFRDVSNLKINVDWATATAAMTPFSIGDIGREAGTHDSFWTIRVNWPAGVITFNAAGFEQTLRKKPIVTRSQCLKITQRGLD